ncbi:hypothetical protein GCM10009116_04070 [Brevundimonas basaltis]|uniref:Uncharacterized protein n=1 Tax=Brevundimonas basaltis TaxID=472166 RepID=A0A7W8HZB1_9CAUL|nr:hypothetical protein [Brevundimonas basaltis]MBB5292676.1 hypothetical protein [Brevundimonas basaltis]
MMKFLAVATVTLAMLGAPAVAQDRSGGGLVKAQLDAIPGEFGVSEVVPRLAGRLATGGKHTARLDVSGGQAIFVGVCDGGCSDLDLIVRDASGRELGRDVEMDDIPMVVIEEAAAGRYSVEVLMEACTGQCDWGVGVFR